MAEATLYRLLYIICVGDDIYCKLATYHLESTVNCNRINNKMKSEQTTKICVFLVCLFIGLNSISFQTIEKQYKYYTHLVCLCIVASL